MSTIDARTQRPTRRRTRALVAAALAAVLVAAVLAFQATSESAPAPTPPGPVSGPLDVANAARSAQEAEPEVRDEGAAESRQQAAAADPALVSSTYLGDLEWDEGTDVEVDEAGHTYVAGFTLSPGFPVRDAAQPAFGGLSDAFLTKLSPDGESAVWSTFIGGVDLDVGNSLAMDDEGNLYVTGRTGSPDFPTTEGAAQPQITGEGCQGEPCHDAFVTKVSPSGDVVYSTYLGGTANEEGISIAVDDDGRAWVTGNTDSPDFPTRDAVQDSFQSLPCQGDLPCPYDVFVAALSPDGRQLEFGSYLGGDGTELSGSIALDEDGDAVVTGATRSEDFPVTDGALQDAINGRACGPPPGEPCLDAFVTKIEASGGSGVGRLDYSTYFGGSNDERGSGVAVDSEGRAVVTGSTESTDLPVRQAVQEQLDNESCTTDQPEEQCDDGFVAQLDPAGAALVYSTYLGGDAQDEGHAVTVDRDGNAYVAGRTDSRDFPVAAAVQESFGGYIDGFAAKLAAGTGQLVWSTFLGGSEADRAVGVDTHPEGSVHLTGRTLSPDFPTRQPFQAELHDADYDAFATVLR